MSHPRPLRRALTALAVGALGAALVAGGQQGVGAVEVGDQVGSDGIGDGYFPLDGNGGLDVLSYRISDRYRFGTGRLAGRTRLTVRATEELDAFHLDLLLPVRGVTVDGVAAEQRKPVRHEVLVTPAAPIVEGQEFEVVVTYAGRPGPIGYAGERNWLANRREVVAMNQPHMAPWWFASNDHPSDKALMDISITVPHRKQVFANGERVSRERHGRVTTHRFRSAEPMSTYLATFAAGRFDVRRGERGGLPWTAVVSRLLGTADREANMDLMRRTPRVVAALEDDLGDYPFSQVGGLVTGLDVGFALENQTLPTYPSTGRGYTALVVHELAHQWFGNSVALRRWRDIWLNEGAATFMEWRWDETHGGGSAKAALCHHYRQRPESSSFWDLEIGDPGPDQIFSGAIYYRGAMTFQALRNRIGEQDFWTLMRRWVRVHRDGVGTRLAFKRMAEDVSGRELEGFFRVWLDAGSRPADLRRNGLNCDVSLG
jgi:aminopeptidase N